MQKDDAKMNDCPSGVDNNMGKYAVRKMVDRRFAIAEMLCKNKKRCQHNFGVALAAFFMKNRV